MADINRPKTDDVAVAPTHPYTCTHCQQQFDSRSNLFRHLRAAGTECANKSKLDPIPQTAKKLAIVLSHWFFPMPHEAAVPIVDNIDAIVAAIIQGCSWGIAHGDARAITELAESIKEGFSSSVDLNDGLNSCCTVISAKLPSLALDIKKVNEALVQTSTRVKLMASTEVITAFNAESRASCRRFEVMVPVQLVKSTNTTTLDRIKHTSFTAHDITTNWTRTDAVKLPDSFRKFSEDTEKFNHDATPLESEGCSFWWSSMQPMETVESTIEWSVKLTEFSTAALLWLCVRVEDQWYVCRKNLFPNDSRGCTSCDQHIVLTFVLDGQRYKWRPMNAITYEVDNPETTTAADLLLPRATINAIGFIQHCGSGVDARVHIGFVETLRRLRESDNKHEGVVSRRTLAVRVKKIFKKLQGKHYFHNFSKHQTSFAKHAERELYNAICHGTIMVDGDEFMVLSVAAHRFGPGEVEKLVALLILLLNDHLPLSFLASVVEPDCLINLPQVPSHLCLCTETHYDGFENANNVQLRPRLGCTGFTSGFTEVDHVVNVNIHRSRQRERVCKAEKVCETTKKWLEKVLHESVPDLLRQHEQYTTGDVQTLHSPAKLDHSQQQHHHHHDHQEPQSQQQYQHHQHHHQHEQHQPRHLQQAQHVKNPQHPQQLSQSVQQTNKDHERLTVFGPHHIINGGAEIDQLSRLLYNEKLVLQPPPANSDSRVAECFSRVLRLLRWLDTSGKWPNTGEQRRKRIAG